MMFYDEDLAKKITSVGRNIIKEYLLFKRKVERRKKIIDLWGIKYE
jgi:hypothetical protein